MAMKRFIFVLVAAIAFIGCMDQDPFGVDWRKINQGPYYLNRFTESEPYSYCVYRGRCWSPVGVFAGGIKAIGWNDKILLANVSGGLRDGDGKWYVLCLQTGGVSGPVSSEEIRSIPLYAGIEILSPEKAFNRKTHYFTRYGGSTANILKGTDK